MAIHFSRHTLKNGLKLIIHPDRSTPLIACNIVYNVGSRDEHPEQTGMAHLFEHFMFCGSKNVPDYDNHLQKIGAVNNAYTSQDITHYYVILPAGNLETVLWLESDRMLELAFDQHQLTIQKQVVMEEFKESFLNRPFGSLWANFNKLLYQQHPYQWLPIGKELSHIENVEMHTMRDFFYHYYRPNNAVITISGNIDPEEVLVLVEKWFGDIPTGPSLAKHYPQEEEQNQPRMEIINEEVPYELLVKGWRMCARLHPDFYGYDLLSDLFGSGRSSYLYKKFVAEEQLFTNLSCHISATFDPGYFVLLGTPGEGVSLEEADQRLSDFLFHFSFDELLAHDLQKVKNKVETILLNNEIKIEDRSSILAVTETLSKAEDFEEEKGKYFAVSEEKIHTLTGTLFRESTSNTLYYRH